MADFCLRCNLALYFGPHSDFAHYGKSGLITVAEVRGGMGMPVLCEGCGPTHVDHLGRCLGGCDLDHAPPDRDEVLQRVEGWLRRRSGRLGRACRLHDRYLETPWEPGAIHFPGTWPWHVREFVKAIYEGRPMQRVNDAEEFGFRLFLDEEWDEI